MKHTKRAPSFSRPGKAGGFSRAKTSDGQKKHFFKAKPRRDAEGDDKPSFKPRLGKSDGFARSGERGDEKKRFHKDKPRDGARSERGARDDDRSSFKPRFGKSSEFSRGGERDNDKKRFYKDKPRDGARGEREGRDRDKSSFKPRFGKSGGFSRDSERGERRYGGDDKPSFKPRFDKKPGASFPKKDRDSEFRPAHKRNPHQAAAAARRTGEREDKTARDGVLIWGLHAARAAWLNPKRTCFRLWVTESGKTSFEKTLNEAKDDLLKRPDFKLTERHELDRLTPPGSVHQGIVLEVAPLHEPGLHEIIGADSPPDLILMLDQVTDPHNVGAILRSASAFGAGAVIMTERNAPAMTGVQAKAASGATEAVPQIHVVNLARALDELQKAGYWRVGLAEEGEKEIAQLDLSARTVLVLGNEGEGLRHLTRQKCDELARLPTGGPVGSLNVSNAAAVALYEVRRQKPKA